MMGDLTDEIVMNMEKALKLSKSTETKHKVFDFVLAGNFNECVECINILNVVDLDEHDIQFLCLKEDGVSYTYGGIKFVGLIEVKKGTTIEGIMRFFRNLDTPLWGCTFMISVCVDVNSWLNSCSKKKTRFVDVVLEKGTLTVPPYSPLFKVIETKAEEPLKSQLMKLAEKGHREAAAVLMSQVLHVPEPEVEDLPDWDRRSRWKKNIY